MAFRGCSPTSSPAPSSPSSPAAAADDFVNAHTGDDYNRHLY
jgi:hypothetical protein